MDYEGYENHEIATVVSYAITFENCEEARRQFQKKFNKDAPPVRTIREWRKRFLETLSIIPSSKGGVKQSDRRLSEEKRQAIVDHFCDDPCSSQRQAARELEVSQSSVNRVLKEEGMRPFKFTRVQELTDQDFEQRKTFCSLILSKESQSPSWTKKIAFSDEATFHLNGQVNLHN